MKAKNSERVGEKLQKAVSNTRDTSPIDSKAVRRIVKADAQVTEDPRPEDFTKQMERQTLRAFLDAVKIWRLNDANSARLVGAEPASSKSGRQARHRRARTSSPA